MKYLSFVIPNNVQPHCKTLIKYFIIEYKLNNGNEKTFWFNLIILLIMENKQSIFQLLKTTFLKDIIIIIVLIMILVYFLFLLIFFVIEICSF